MQETKTPNTGRNLIGAKIYFDGSQWIAIPHTERPYRKRGNKIRAKPNESETVAEFEQASKKPKANDESERKRSLKSLHRYLRANNRQANLWKNSLTG